jgi:hypothetical protein
VHKLLIRSLRPWTRSQAVEIHIQQLNSGMIKTEFDMTSISLEPYAVDDKTIAVTPRMVCEILIVLYVRTDASSYVCHMIAYHPTLSNLQADPFPLLLDPFRWSCKVTMSSWKSKMQE